MKEGIEGPDCTIFCKGDCCSIKIDVPKILAQEYIKRSYATEADFIRSNLFSFHLRFDEKTGKCFLYDKSINGCKVHFSGIKPPQCWIYPTNFKNDQNEIRCKRLSGWSIKSQEKTSKAEKLLEYYIFLCKLEARKEINSIGDRISKYRQVLISRVKDCPPSKLGGFKDGWNHLEILSAEGFSLQMKKFCLKYKNDCTFLPDEFLECKGICEKIANQLVNILLNNIKYILAGEELDYDGFIPLHKLFGHRF
jgi:hypothetical protein